jgi:uncharacterized DUF497 family protein
MRESKPELSRDIALRIRHSELSAVRGRIATSISEESFAMTEDDIFVRRLLDRIRTVEWNEEKAASNRRKHGVDFDEAVEIFYGTSLLRRSDRNDEERWLAIGETEGRIVTVVFTWRGDALRIIWHAAHEEMKSERIIKRKWGERRKGKTDWAAVDALTDKEIEEAARNDPDAVPLDVDWSEAVLVIPPKKKAISIRVDEDVLDYFRKEGAGYQRRMNAVLRSFMQQKRKKRA